MTSSTLSPEVTTDYYEAHTCASLARRCGASYSTVSRWIRDGQVHSVRAEDAAAFVVSRDEIARLRARSEKQLESKAARFPATELETIFRRAMPAPPTRPPFTQ